MSTKVKIPRVVAEWILLKLPERKEDGMLTSLEFNGLSTLRIPELKRIESLLYATESVRNESSIMVRSLNGSAKKQHRIDFILRALYKNDNCTQWNDSLMNELQMEVSGSTAVSASAAKIQQGTSTPSSLFRGKKRSRDPIASNTDDFNAGSSSSTTKASSSTTTGSNRASINPTNGRMNSSADGLSRSYYFVTQSKSSSSENRNPQASGHVPTAPASSMANRYRFGSTTQPFGSSHTAMAGNRVAHSASPSWMYGSHAATAGIDFNATMMRNQSYADTRTFSSSVAPLTSGAAVTTTTTTSSHPNILRQHPGSTNGRHIHFSPHHDGNTTHLASMSGAVPPGNSTGATSALPTTATNLPPNTSDPNNQPQNPTEVRLMEELAQMGFSDRQEMINGIRQSEKTTADEVMLFIITQREEAAEARKEDEVRLLSEEQKNEQQQLKKALRAEKLASAKTGKDLKDIFEKSWILKGLLPDNGSGESSIVDAALMKHRRTEFLELLDLEEKSAKWYFGLPSYYFQNLCSRLKTDHVGTIDWLPVECETLLRGLTQLNAQVGGRPKIFVDAMDQATGGNDDQIIVID
ncbi:hypothetical protein IV203_031212 [Nitzschia inconspicua]|uniref:UBA domain-containing protein n=1 Tax=Nitzschia inconspicua TaxID=303405 RepID=A0A9K3LUW9_9STRA|nr:hypothetical protein IV203_031212 [Nitzschia inconspicua]